MKKIYFLNLIIIFMCLSCNDNNDINSTLPSGKIYKVSLSLSGDIISSIEDSVMRTKSHSSPSNIYYGVNIYKAVKSNEWLSYAYGVFSDVKDMTISLADTCRYKFQCTAVKNLVDTLYYGEFHPHNPHYEGGKKGFAEPFVVDDFDFSFIEFKNPQVMKHFIPDNTMASILKGTSYVVDGNYGKLLDNPQLDRYYGELSNFVPSSEGTAIIEMKRCSFGIKIKLNNIADGKIKVSMPFDKWEMDSARNSVKAIYSFNKVYECWKESNYSSETWISIIWERSNGELQYFKNQVELKPNVMTIINIDAVDKKPNYSLGLDFKDIPMTNDTFYWEIDGGEL